MFFEKRFLKTIDQIRGRVAVPLRIELWNGRQFDFCSEPSVTVTIPNSSALRYFISPNLNKLGEAFVEGHIRVEGSPKNVFKVAESLARSVTARLPSAFQWASHHSRDRDRKAIQYHYDVANEFYALFLDRDMVYSCAYYQNDSDTLESAQSQKLDHILNKLMLKPGEKFLDIGCGWGALIMRAAQKYGAIATGITLSKNQFDRAREQIHRAGLDDRCQVFLCDYRDLNESAAYDKIASVGMFEHVGLKNLPIYFEAIHRLLKDDGMVLNHGITTSDVESRWIGMGAGEFIDRYVFPHGELPHVSLALKEMASAGLEVVDVESLRRHYARTCEAWSNNLESHRLDAEGIVGERRYRIWQIYLAGCAYGFSHGWMNLYQVLCGKAGNCEMRQQPLTRDYMYAGRL
jgi:cyclopropane-fatty-acyl-phospholipid synthase